MKNYLLIFSFLFSILFSAYSQNDFKKMSQEEISEGDLQSLTQLIEKIMDGQKSGNYYLLTADEASAEMVKAFTANVQKETYQTVLKSFGEYSSLEFAEALSSGSYVIYRFRASFNNTDQRPEIRAVLNEDGKLGGFWIKPWKDDIGENP